MEANRAPVRRTQADRTSAMREKIVLATIATLHRDGYQTTTMNLVATEAGVSKGALTHHFAAKTDLMLAVVDEVLRQDTALHEQAVAELSPREYQRRSVEIAWRVINRPASIAVLEIMLASRSDPQLARKLKARQQEIDVQAFAWSGERQREALGHPLPQHEAAHRLIVAAMRGLAIEMLFMGNLSEVEQSVNLLATLMQKQFRIDLVEA